MNVMLNCPSGCETIHHRLKCGAQIYIIPKNRNISVGAVVIGYGAADREFYYENKYYKVPYGTAHFLEHQMFEQPEGNIMERFAELGAEANAFTDSGKTVYYFKTAENFIENFRVLLDFVETPYFEKTSVENEKSIIKNEIAMYDDEPEWKTFFTALKNLWPESPMAQEIAGSAESVEKINSDILYACHKAFYTPENMTIICGGDVCADEIMTEADKILGGATVQTAKTAYMDTEPVGGFTEINMDIKVPRFSLVYPININGNRTENIFSLKLAAEAMFGESSGMFKMLSDEGIMSDVPSVEIYEHKGLAYMSVSGIATEPKKAVEAVQNTVIDIKSRGVDRRTFERLRKKLSGEFIKMADDCEQAVMTQAEFREKSLAETAKTVRNLKYEDCDISSIGTNAGICVANGE